jgi:hypothetical protein
MGRHALERKSVVSRAFSPVTSAATAALQLAPVRAATSVRNRRGFKGFILTAAFLMVSIVDPYSATLASADSFGRSGTAADQTFEDFTTTQITVERGGYQVISGKAASAIFVELADIPDAGSIKAYAYESLAKRGWGMDQYSCLVKLWNRESHWRVNAHNLNSGAYGIPQALPGIKMASAGDDWMTNPQTQINWGIGYISGRYHTPCGALAHSNTYNWY